MGKHRRERTGRLADMSSPIPVADYKPPPVTACDPYEYPVVLESGQELFVRQSIYKGHVVDFAIVLLHPDAKSSDGQIARIDCCHGTVHRHVFNRQGDDVLDRQVIQEIPSEGGWNVVDRLFRECLDRMMSESEEIRRRWEAS